MPTLSNAEPQLFVTDLAASCTFYERALGFAVAFTYGEPPFYAQVVRDDARLNLRQLDRLTVDPRRERDELLAASITLDDAAALFAEYEHADVSFARPLHRESWGAHTFVVRDPDGNLLLFAGRAAGGASPAANG